MRNDARKQVLHLLETLPKTRAMERLRSEFKQKGFLSKRELKELLSIQAARTAQLEKLSVDPVTSSAQAA